MYLSQFLLDFCQSLHFIVVIYKHVFGVMPAQKLQFTTGLDETKHC